MLGAVPIIRDLKRCRRSDFSEALKEVFNSFLLALIPIWLGAVVLLLIRSASFLQYVSDFFTSGEALLVSTALIGPNIYIVTKRYDSFRNFSISFPQAWFLTVVSFVLCMITAEIFGSQRVYAQFNPTPKEALFDADLMFRFSLVIFLITAVALYLVTVFKNFAESGAASEMRSDEQDFLDAWNAKSKGKGRRK